MSAQRGRDRFLDVIRSLALARVILWHTWSAAWLTWFPAMPAMFFATGALLDDSVERRGWWPTVRQRARRLLIPFWVYGAVSVSVMVLGGWRPGPGDLVGWILPVVDPVGSPQLRGLWVPLWYVRAYVWFVLAAGVLRWLVRRIGFATPVVFAAVTVAMWAAEQASRTDLLPLPVLDLLTYGTFVTAGMCYAARDRIVPATRTAVSAAVLFGVAAVAEVWRFGPDDLVVNRSAVLTMLVGGAGLMVMLALHPFLSQVGGRAGRSVDVVIRRTLTIYLWHGFGLVAAAELVDARFDPGPLRWMLSLAVVVVVTAGCVAAVGWVEDVAAGRRSLRSVIRGRLPSEAGGAWHVVPVTPVAPIPVAPNRVAAALMALIPAIPVVASAGGVDLAGAVRPSRRRQVVGVAGAVVAAVLVAPSLVTPSTDTNVAEPLSGRAVVARAGLVGATTTTTTTTTPSPGATIPERTPATEIEAWLERHPQLRSEGGLSSMRGALVAADGTLITFTWHDGGPVAIDDPSVDGDGSEEGPTVWWSMTKTATATWLMRSVEAGVVSLDDPLSRWVPEAPHADRMTLEQLARHQAGIPRSVDDSLFETTPAEVLKRWTRNPKLLFEPGTGFEYSRAGYLYLALALERATGTTWREAMDDMAGHAGVHLTFDEDVDPVDHVTDPDHHGYRGRSWSSGGIVSDPATMAGFYRWVFTEGLSHESIDAMSAFDGSKGDWIYGIGLMPLCPCERDGELVRSRRMGLDAVSGTFAVDRDSGAVVVLFPNQWFVPDGGPRPEFYELTSVLLDVLDPNPAPSPP